MATHISAKINKTTVMGWSGKAYSSNKDYNNIKLPIRKGAMKNVTRLGKFRYYSTKKFLKLGIKCCRFDCEQDQYYLIKDE